LRIAGATPYYLNSYASRENAQLRINLSNPELGFQDEEIELPRNSIHIERNLVIAGAALFHKLIVKNYARLPVEIPLVSCSASISLISSKFGASDVLTRDRTLTMR
jgi:N-terminal domain of (some) glycogen debranching enzymes